MFEFPKKKVLDELDKNPNFTANREMESVGRFLGINEGDLKNKKVLDLGSGNASVAQELSLKGIEVHSLDLLCKPIETPKHSVGPFVSKFGQDAYDKAKAKAVTGQAEYLPYRDESFDTVIALFSIPFYSPDEAHLEQVLKEIVRVLKNGGEARLGPLYMQILEKETFTKDENEKRTENILGTILRKISDCEYKFDWTRNNAMLIIKKPKTS